MQIFAELQASGNGNEEFWVSCKRLYLRHVRTCSRCAPQYFNAPNQFVSTLPTFGEGPFREVRLLIDGQVAGVAFPYVFKCIVESFYWANFLSKFIDMLSFSLEGLSRRLGDLLLLMVPWISPTTSSTLRPSFHC